MGKGLVVSPHHSASKAGAAVLHNGGDCVEAAVAVAATLCAVYPHMSGLGGDAFWLIARHDTLPQTPPTFIDACGPAGKNVSLETLHAHGYTKIPTRGSWSALTMAGAVEGWNKALATSHTWDLPGHNKQSLSALFHEAVTYARDGVVVTPLLHEMLAKNARVLSTDRGFKDVFYPHNEAPEIGSYIYLPALARTFERLASDGLESFYTGALANDMIADLQKLGSPLCAEDFAYEAQVGKALSMTTSHGVFYNSPPPTQGIASLLILGQLFALQDAGRLDVHDESANVHAIVEATKKAFMLRSKAVADPAFMQEDVNEWLNTDFMKEMTQDISFEQAAPWPITSQPGDTVWFGVVDRWGNAVSCIQSIYHEFGSGMLLPSTGIIWHNRALGFSLDPAHVNCLAPGKKPFHTLNPAMAQLKDGRLLSYGTMGGEGQPQTQAALMYRYVGKGDAPSEVLKAPRWLLGRTWGDATDSLKVEEDLDNRTLSYLHARGHAVEILEARSSVMGHAGLIVRHPDGRLEGASDPRSDGSVEEA